MAKDYAIPGTSKMKRAELLDAVKARLNRAVKAQLNRGEATDGDEQSSEKSGGMGAKLQTKTKDALYKLASDCHIDGRSKMTKEELAAAVANEMRHSREVRASL